MEQPELMETCLLAGPEDKEKALWMEYGWSPPASQAFKPDAWFEVLEQPAMNLETRRSSCTMLRGCTWGMSPSGGPTCPWGPGYCPHWDRDFPSVLLHENGKVWKDPAVVAVKSSSVCGPGAQSHQDTWPNPLYWQGRWPCVSCMDRCSVPH